MVRPEYMSQRAHEPRSQLGTTPDPSFSAADGEGVPSSCMQRKPVSRSLVVRVSSVNRDVWAISARSMRRVFLLALLFACATAWHAVPPLVTSRAISITSITSPSVYMLRAKTATSMDSATYMKSSLLRMRGGAVECERRAQAARKEMRVLLEWFMLGMVAGIITRVPRRARLHL